MMTKRDQKSTAKTPAKRKQSATRANSLAKPAAKKVAPKKRKQTKSADKARELQIAEAAYLIAKNRSFEGGCALDDWLQAEAEIDAKISS